MSDETRSEFFRDRARKAAEARWAKERHYQRLETIAAGLRAANPKLTEAQAITQALIQNPQIYADYVAAASNTPQMTHGEMIAAMEQEVSDICKIAGKPAMARFFIDQGTHPRDVIRYFLALTGEPPKKK
jgi:hypothetical protein